MAERSTLVNALIGAVVAVVLSPLQFSALIGGGVAGYLEGPDTDAGLRVGALAGLFTIIPLFIIFWILGGLFLGFVPMMDGPQMMFGGAGFGLLAIFLLFFVVFTVVLSSAGGYLGAYLNQEDVL
jgi:hypothetical protein